MITMILGSEQILKFWLLKCLSAQIMAGEKASALTGLRERKHPCIFLVPAQTTLTPASPLNDRLPAKCLLTHLLLLGQLCLSWCDAFDVFCLLCSQLGGSKLILAVYRWSRGRAWATEEVRGLPSSFGHSCQGNLDTSPDLYESSLVPGSEINGGRRLHPTPEVSDLVYEAKFSGGVSLKMIFKVIVQGVIFFISAYFPWRQVIVYL